MVGLVACLVRAIGPIALAALVHNLVIFALAQGYGRMHTYTYT